MDKTTIVSCISTVIFCPLSLYTGQKNLTGTLHWTSDLVFMLFEEIKSYKFVATLTFAAKVFSTWIHPDHQVFPTEIISMMQLCAEVLVTKPQQLWVLNKNKPVIVWPDSSQPISDFLCRVSSTEQSICQVFPAILGYHFLGFWSQVLSWKIRYSLKNMTLYYLAIVVPHSGKIKHDIATREFMLGLRYHKASLISKWGRL